MCAPAPGSTFTPSFRFDFLPLKQPSLTDGSGPFETIHNQPRYDKSGNTRSKQRARKLQLGDIDW